MLIEWIKSESDHFCSVNGNRTNQIRTLDRFNLTNVDWINQGSTKSNSPKLASVSCRNSDNNDNNNKDKSEGNVQKSASARVDASDAPKRRPFNGSDSFHSISFFFCLFVLWCYFKSFGTFITRLAANPVNPINPRHQLLGWKLSHVVFRKAS